LAQGDGVFGWTTGSLRPEGDAGVDVITIADDLLKKLDLLGKDLDDYSLETVQMFQRDAANAKYVV
jgi:transaldolase